MRFFRGDLAILLSLSCLGAPVGAQQAQTHVVDPGALDQALAAEAEDAAAKRDTIRTALRQPQVRKVAEQLGLNLSRAQAAIATLDGVVLDQLAAQAGLVNDQIAGGQTVQVNLLWVIIGLLVIILIIVAA